MKNELYILQDVLEKLRMLKNHVNHEYNVDMFNMNEAVRRLEHFAEELKNDEEFKKNQEGD